MIKVKGTFSDAVGMLTVGQYDAARRDLEDALGIDHGSRTSWSLYIRGQRTWPINKVLECKKVFANYGIDWDYDCGNVAVNTLTRRPASVRPKERAEVDEPVNADM